MSTSSTNSQAIISGGFDVIAHQFPPTNYPTDVDPVTRVTECDYGTECPCIGITPSTGGGSGGTITVSEATTTSAGIVKTCNASTGAATSKTVSLVPTQYFVQSEVSRLEGLISSASSTTIVSSTTVLSNSAATTASAGIVQTRIASDSQITSTVVDVVPTQYYLQTEVSRLEGLISSASSTTIVSSTTVLSNSEATLQSAGIVTTCNSSSGEVTSETVSVVPTQYFVQSEVTRLEGLISAAGTGDGGTSYNPWTAYDAVTSNNGTIDANITAGGAYKIDIPDSATCTINATVSSGAVGTDAYISIYDLHNAATVVAGSNVVFADIVEPHVINNCVVKFRDGTGYVYVENHLGGAIVDATEITPGSQTLVSALSQANPETYISFLPTTDGIWQDMRGIYIRKQARIAGNGRDKTFMGGHALCSSSFELHDLTIQNTSIGFTNNAISFLYNVNVGSSCIFETPMGFQRGITRVTDTVSAHNGCSCYNGAVIDGSGTINLCNKSHLQMLDGAARVQNIQFTSGSAGAGGAFYVSNGASLTVRSGTISHCSATSGGVFMARGSGTYMALLDCTYTDINCTNGVLLVDSGASMYISGCTCGTVTATNGGGAGAILANSYATYENTIMGDQGLKGGDNAVICFAGSITYRGATKMTSKSFMRVSKGATLDFTNNTTATVLSAGSGIIVGQYTNAASSAWSMTGSATVITSGGESVIISGSGTKITNAGVLE